MDLSLKYIDKRRERRVEPLSVPTPNIMSGLIASDLKTNVAKRSAVVRQSGKVLQHINLKNVRDWFVEGRRLTIIEVDNVIPIILIFLTSPEANAGEIRFTQIINGAVLI